MLRIFRRLLSTGKVAPTTSDHLRQVMRSVAQPVAVVTCRLQDSTPGDTEHDHGATLSSLSSISLSPPIVAFSLRLPSRLASHLTSTSAASRTAPTFSVHLLSLEQEDVARAFARQPPLPEKAVPSPELSPSAPACEATSKTPHFSSALFDQVRTNSLGELRCRVVKRLNLHELETIGGEGEDFDPNSIKGEAHSSTDEAGPRSELFLARVESVRLPEQPRSSDERGQAGARVSSLVYWDQGYRGVP